MCLESEPLVCRLLLPASSAPRSLGCPDGACCRDGMAIPTGACPRPWTTVHTAMNAVGRLAAACAVSTLLLALCPVTLAYGCSLVRAPVVFTGVATSKASGDVTYRVTSIEGELRRAERWAERLAVPEGFVDIGKPTVVSYDYDRGSRFIEVGKSYEVAAWFSPSEATLTSGVRTAEDHCGGGGTRYADGSDIVTARYVLGIRLWPYWTVAGGLILLTLANRRRIRIARQPVASN